MFIWNIFQSDRMTTDGLAVFVHIVQAAVAVEAIYERNHAFSISYLKTLRFCSVFLLGSQLGATFYATTFDDVSSGFGRNTCTKSVSLGAVPGVWLECSFWHICTILPKITSFSKIRLEILWIGLFGMQSCPLKTDVFPHIYWGNGPLCITPTPIS